MPYLKCSARMSSSLPSRQLNNSKSQGNINHITAFLESIPYIEGNHEELDCFFYFIDNVGKHGEWFESDKALAVTLKLKGGGNFILSK